MLARARWQGRERRRVAAVCFNGLLGSSRERRRSVPVAFRPEVDELGGGHQSCFAAGSEACGEGAKRQKRGQKRRVDRSRRGRVRGKHHGRAERGDRTRGDRARKALTAGLSSERRRSGGRSRSRSRAGSSTEHEQSGRRGCARTERAGRAGIRLGRDLNRWMKLTAMGVAALAIRTARTFPKPVAISLPLRSAQRTAVKQRPHQES